MAHLETTKPPASLPVARPIERRQGADLPYHRFVLEYVIPNRPVIIEDAVPAWPSLHRWTPEFFRSTYGSREVDVTYGVRRPMGEVIDEILCSTREKPGPYLHRVIIHRDMPELLSDLAPENIYGSPRRYASPLMPRHFYRPDGYLKLLIGGVGGKFPMMHVDTDNADALITEIYGEKEFVLFSPSDTAFVYPSASGGHTSQIEDLDHPDLEKFPLFARATPYRAIIGPGDAAYIPSAWWHAARVVTTSISVCTNMMHRANWRGFIAEACDPINGSWASRSLKRIYLGSAGAAMSASEWSQAKFPESPLVRKLAFLSPPANATSASYRP